MFLNRCRENMARVRQSRPDSGLGFQTKSLYTFKVFPVRSERGLADRRERASERERERESESERESEREIERERERESERERERQRDRERERASDRASVCEREG